MKLNELVMEGVKKNVKLLGPLGSQVGRRGFTVGDVQDLESDITDALKPLKLRRSIDFIFRNGAIQFTKKEQVTPAVMKMLKKFQKN